MDIRNGLLVAILSAGVTFAAMSSFGHKSENKNPPGCECSPKCNCPECKCTPSGLNDQSPAMIQWPSEAMNFKSVGGGWWTFEMDVAGKRRTFMHNGKGGLTELHGATPGSPGSLPGKSGDAPPTK